MKPVIKLGNKTKQNKIGPEGSVLAQNAKTSMVETSYQGLSKISILNHKFLTSYFSREDSISQKAVLQLYPVLLHAICSRFNNWVAGAIEVKFNSCSRKQQWQLVSPSLGIKPGMSQCPTTWATTAPTIKGSDASATGLVCSWV